MGEMMELLEEIDEFMRGDYGLDGTTIRKSVELLKKAAAEVESLQADKAELLRLLEYVLSDEENDALSKRVIEVLPKYADKHSTSDRCKGCNGIGRIADDACSLCGGSGSAGGGEG